MAALFDTSVAVLLLRRRPPPEAVALIAAARAEIASGTGLLPAPALAELILGERSGAGARRLAAALERIPAAILPLEAARAAGAMGAFLALQGALIPYPDLLIAATAAWLDVPLLAWDQDYPRSRRLALASTSRHPGAKLLRRVEIHPASLGA